MSKSTLHAALLCSALLALGACKSGGESDPAYPQPDGPDAPPVDGPADPVGQLGGWFVTEFNPQLLAAVREQTRYVRQRLSYEWSVGSDAAPDGLKVRNSNPFEEAGLAHAWSTGLTGEGVTISIIDSRIDESHEALGGQAVDLAPRSAGYTSTHGTSVASVAAGPGGVAPGAALHHGAIDFDSTLSISALAGMMRDARDAGALVSNNSWSFQTRIDNIQGRSFLNTTDGKSYVNSLREFTSNGIVVFAASNDRASTSAHLMAALPSLHGELEKGWLTVINGVPTLSDDDVVSASRISAACMEAARWCLAANGQVRLADPTEGAEGYKLGSGASFAAPQVSGALALLAEAFPALSAADLRARLLVTADNGFFSHEDTVEFAPGIFHGYNSEWGHGFLDVKAALLPIGALRSPTAAGGEVDLDRMAVVSGAAVGDAMARSLETVEMVIQDRMEGSFTAPASMLALPASESGTGRITLAEQLASRDIGHFRAAARSAASGNTMAAMHVPATLSTSASHSIEDGIEIDLGRGADYRIAAITTGEPQGDVGLRASRIFTGERAGFELGFEALRERDAIMGVTGLDANGGSSHMAITAGAALNLGRDALLRFDGRFGRAEGGQLGAMVRVNDMSFDSYGVSLSFAGGIARDDVLTFYARQPVAVTRGAAEITMARQADGGRVDFSPTRIDMSPEDRQIDIGLEYLRPLGQRTDMALAARWSDNHRNVDGRRDAEMGISLSHRF